MPMGVFCTLLKTYRILPFREFNVEKKVKVEL